MSENVEFISAAELPTTDAEEIDVLCVENGELKRKPAANLGGNGGGFMLKPALDELVPIDGSPTVTCTVDYDELAKALEKGVACSILFPAETMGPVPMVLSITGWTYAPDEGEFTVFTLDPSGGVGMWVLIFPNGTYVPSLE